MLLLENGIGKKVGKKCNISLLNLLNEKRKAILEIEYSILNDSGAYTSL